jgi:hypothetical protein
VERRLDDFFITVDKGFREQGESLKRIAQHPPGDDEKHAALLRSLEHATAAVAELTTTGRMPA